VLDAAQRAYAAGLVDGEGCIWIARTVRYRNPSYFLGVYIANTDWRMIDWMHAHFGGTIRNRPPDPRANRRQVFYWQVLAGKAVAFLEQVQPWLVIKSREAELGIALQRRVSAWPKGYAPLTPDEIEQRDALRRELHAGRRHVAHPASSVTRRSSASAAAGRRRITTRRPAPDTPTWEGEADAWVHDSTRQASDLSGGLNLVKTTYVVLPGELSRYLSNGDTITFEHDTGELSSRDVREIDGPYNPNGWPYSTMRVWLAPE
jgi:hypothetical protein